MVVKPNNKDVSPVHLKSLKYTNVHCNVKTFAGEKVWDQTKIWKLISLLNDTDTIIDVALITPANFAF